MRRMRRSTLARLRWTLIIATAIILGLGVFLLSSMHTSTPYLQRSLAYAQDVPEEVKAEKAEAPIVLTDLGLDSARFVWEDDVAYQTLDDGRRVRLTLDRGLQKTLEKQMNDRKVPYGSVVALEPSTGRVLAMVSTQWATPKYEEFALRANSPSASVFKLITAAALLEMSSIDTKARICYSGGASMLTESDVRGNPATDKRCNTLEEAIGQSINAVIARLAYQSLDRERLEATALKFGFNREIPFEMPVDISEANFVDDDIERAKIAAGFWHVNLSAMHGALLSAAIANRGIMMRPSIVDAVLSPSGDTLYRFKATPWLVSMSPTKAQELSRMAENTTKEGSARRTFYARNDWPKELRVGGKTGTLSNKKPFYLFTWFVGWAPLENPDIAVGALVVNTEKWWIKGTHVGARAILHHYKNK